MAELNSKPCLVQTAQGFSVTYKEKLLYSKYNPQKNILSIIKNTTILPGTIILCLSPVLEYGLEELYKKCPENCIAFGIEKDADLYELSKNSISDKAYTKSGFFNLVQPENINTLPSLFEILCKKGEYRRVISMDFSGGAQFYRDFYTALSPAPATIIALSVLSSLILLGKYFKFFRIFEEYFRPNLTSVTRFFQN